jgi:hypothetical protein
MSTLAKSVPKIRRAYVPTTALAQSVEFDDDMMHVFLTDGRIISMPLIWFPLLYEATPEQRERYETGGGGVSLHSALTPAATRSRPSSAPASATAKPSKTEWGLFKLM